MCLPCIAEGSDVSCQLTYMHYTCTFILILMWGWWSGIISSWAQQMLHISHFIHITLVSFFFHTVPSWGVKDGMTRWHLKSAFPSPVHQSVPFPSRQQPPSPPFTGCTNTRAHAPSPCPLTMISLVTLHVESRLRPLDAHDTHVWLRSDLRGH